MFNSKKLKGKSLYDKLVCLLLVWCVLQDFVLCVMLRLTGATSFVKLFFYSKDVILLALFLAAILRKKIPSRFAVCCLSYFGIIAIQAFVGMNYCSIEFTSMLSAIRGLVLLPMLTLVGYAIHDKIVFTSFIKKYYSFLTIIALIGLIEFVADIVFGTKTFWMDYLRLDDYYISIKGASAGLENGTPGNWYTDIGAGYRTQKRLISIWAAPLTAGFVLLMPCMYYTLLFFKRKKWLSLNISKRGLYPFGGFVLTAIALVLTFTRQTLLLYIVFAFFIFAHYREKNKQIIVIGAFAITLVLALILSESIMNYMFNGSTMVHILRLQEAISKMSVFGKGIGSFGTRFAGAIATESQYLTLVGQLGIIPLGLYLIMFIYPVVYVIKRAHKMGGELKLIMYSICFCGIIYAIAGLVSETVAAFTSIAQYYVLTGYVWGYCKQNERYITENENENYSNVSSAVSQNT